MRHEADISGPWSGPAAWSCSCGAGGVEPTIAEAVAALRRHKADTEAQP